MFDGVSIPGEETVLPCLSTPNSLNTPVTVGDAAAVRSMLTVASVDHVASSYNHESDTLSYVP